MGKYIKAALISDIHGNLPALEAVLKDIKSQNIQKILCLGDITGISPFPNEVIKRLIDIEAVCVIGNYDLRVLEFYEKKLTTIAQKEKNAIFFKWNSENLLPDSISFLQKLKKRKYLKICETQILLTHAGGMVEDEILDENTPSSRFKEIADSTKAKIIAFGHSHQTFLHYISGKMFINPGSVGKFSKNQTMASYAIIEFKDNSFKTAFEQIDIDIQVCTEKLLDIGMPKDIIEKYILSFNIPQRQMNKKIKSLPFDAKYAEKALMAVMRIAEKYDDEPEHFHQVEKLSLTLFEKLKSIHNLSEREKFILQCAAILHDIGWINGQIYHHKTAMDMILKDVQIPVTAADRKIIAITARYHRKSIPSEGHKIYRDMTSAEKKTVSLIASMLRIADGLDRSHLSLVKNLHCSLTDDRIVISLSGIADLDLELKAAQRKSDLMEKVLNKKVIFEIE